MGAGGAGGGDGGQWTKRRRSLDNIPRTSPGRVAHQTKIAQLHRVDNKRTKERGAVTSPPPSL
jgi:hypothetical protein